MLATVLTAITSFISTNIDDIFLLMLFFVQAEGTKGKHCVVIGQYLGMGILTAVSLLGSAALQVIPAEYIRFLGVIPIVLGIKEWIEYRKGEEAEETDAPQAKDSAMQHILSITLICIANGADNIGVYIPLFAGYSQKQMLLVVIVFACMTALLCFFGQKLASLPMLQAGIQKYKHILVPLLFIALGIYILLA